MASHKEIFEAIATAEDIRILSLGQLGLSGATRVRRSKPVQGWCKKQSKLLVSLGAIGSGCLMYYTLPCSRPVLQGKESIRHEVIQPLSNCVHHKDSIWFHLFRFLTPDLIWIIISIPSALLAAYYNIQINLSLGSLMNVIQQCLKSSEILSSEDFFASFIKLVKEPARQLFLNYCFQSIFTFSYLYSLFVLAEQTANRMRIELFSKFLSLELDFFDLNNGGHILSTLSNDVQEFKSSFKQLISLGIRNFAQIVGCVYTLYHLSPEMTITINLVVIPVMALIGSQVGSRLRKISNNINQQLANITNIACESLNNIRTVKILAIENLLISNFIHETQIFDRLNQKFAVGFALFQGMTNFAVNGIVMVTLLFGGFNLLSGKMSAGNLMSFLATTQTIQRSLFQLSLLYGHYIKTTSALHKICYYLSINSIKSTGQTLKTIKGDVEFKNVNFCYPKRPESTVLKDLDLKLQCGKITALCGVSGSGKSTIGMLIANLYDLLSGSIRLDNIELSQLDKEWLRKDVIGYISQEPILFCTSIKENIRYGKPNATDAEIERAAKLANAHNFIQHFPDGYDTVVGQQGTALSGGQRQRIAIARAIIKNPKILILDEATSALDSESEAQVQKALDRVMVGRTVLVIAHRLSTILNANHIVLLHNGRILESGTHQELMANKAKYYHLVRRATQTNQDHVDS